MITDPTVEKFLYDVLPPRDPVLSAMEAEAKKRHIPIVGPAVGRLLHQYALITGAKRVFELGSAIGYSTIWFARALPANGKVWYTDGDPANAKEAKGWFAKAKVSKKVEVLTGDALDQLDSVKGSFDIIFCDIDKHGYPDAFKRAIPRLAKGGLFIADNTLWGGRVAQPDIGDDENTRGVRVLDKLLFESKSLLTTLVPLRDGVAVALKL
jgi:predicted O-methyltransferase YrrM